MSAVPDEVADAILALCFLWSLVEVQTSKSEAECLVVTTGHFFENKMAACLTDGSERNTAWNFIKMTLALSS